MRLQDLHTHSVFDDGSASLEEMVVSAVGKGLSGIGLSGHSPIKNESWTIQAAHLPEYCEEAKRLKEKYHEKIQVFCGIEYDSRSNPIDLSQFDYVIGSNHAIITEKGSFDVDNTVEAAKNGVNICFDGDFDAAAVYYYSQYREMAENPEIDIIGHFDLLTKFDEKAALYQESHPCYLQAAKAAMERLVRAGKIFEVNSGAISRGYRTAPYPSKELLCFLRELDGKVCLSSDAHSANGVGFAFEQSLSLIKSCGFDQIWILTADGFQPFLISRKI